MLVIDDLVGWLVGRLADAGYQRLSTLLRGSEQDRALRQAASAAVQATAEELIPSGGEEAGRFATAIAELFRRPEHGGLLASQGTLLETLQASIAGRLAVLDDAGRTGVERLPLGGRGIPGTVVAHKLTAHLVREIIHRGSAGGPLTPLASQLNHDLTHLQGQEIIGMLAQLASEVRTTAAQPGSGTNTMMGWPLEEILDPFALEVHRPVRPDIPQDGLSMLPAYVPREHDVALTEVVIAAAKGASGLTVLVGGSSTGKTRACWEALGLLRAQQRPWRLWHPIDPSRPEAALRELPDLGPRTVVWLNDAQFYLADPGGGERVAAGLRELLRDPGRRPVLVLATLWPTFWAQLTTRPAEGDPDPHAQARELLAGRDIPVPAAFTQAQVQRLTEAEDPRLVQAAAASDRQVTQYLAGVPELLARYRNAPSAAAALIDAAMDARRLGMRLTLSRAFLEAAAPGYLANTEWEQLGEDWLEQALVYAAAPCKGVSGPLTRIRRRPTEPPDTPAARSPEPTYHLADYLDQHGRRARCEQIPPMAFWMAAANYADPVDLDTVGDAARARGLYRDAVQLYKRASAHGDPGAAGSLVQLMHKMHPADLRPATWVTSHARLYDARAVAVLLRALREIGASDQLTTLLAADPAAHVHLDDPPAIAMLLDILLEMAAWDQLATLLNRHPAVHVRLDDPGDVAFLLAALRKFRIPDEITALASRAAANVPVQEPRPVGRLLNELHLAHAADQLAILASRVAAELPLDNIVNVPWLLETLQRIGASDQLTVLASRAAALAPLIVAPREQAVEVFGLLFALQRAGADDQLTVLASRITQFPLDHPGLVASLLESLQTVGARDQLTKLAWRAVEVPFDRPGLVAALMDALREVGAGDQLAALVARDPANHVRLDDPGSVARLLGALQELEGDDQLAALASRAAAYVRLDDPGSVARLLDTLRDIGASKQFAALVARDPAAHVRLDSPGSVARLLDTLRDIGASEQLNKLADRAAASTRLDNPKDVSRLLDALRRAGASARTAILTGRLPGAGHFKLFCEQQGNQDQFRFGQEPDGSPAVCSWEDLGRRR